jgi:hypothetical protein
MEKKEIVNTEGEFWIAYYERTGNYNVGYGATVYTVPSRNRIVERLTNIVLEKYQLPNGKYWLPDYINGRQPTNKQIKNEQ